MTEIVLKKLKYEIDGQLILDGIDLKFVEGETFAIMGPSGCGKSTLLRLIMGLINPTAGSIEVDGVNTTNLTRNEWREIRHKMGMVFQSSALFDSLTVYDNVAFGLRRNGLAEEKVRPRVLESLAIVGLDEVVAEKMPADLSGGMKKRTAIARAIATAPPVLLYDEPTTGLDPIIADTINELIRDLQAQLCITSIVVTHDIISAVKVANRVGLLHQGKLLEVREASDLKNAVHPMLQQFLKHYYHNSD
jgi:phospholipid/cholesterol/gamma-HCH transport system ATP-binding protein